MNFKNYGINVVLIKVVFNFKLFGIRRFSRPKGRSIDTLNLQKF